MNPVSQNMVRAHVYNAITEDMIAKFVMSIVPREGELIGVVPEFLKDGDPFKRHTVWRVDRVYWQVASPGSQFVNERIATDRLLIDSHTGVLSDVDLLCRPHPGPFWADTPAWAKVLSENEDE